MGLPRAHGLKLASHKKTVIKLLPQLRPHQLPQQRRLHQLPQQRKLHQLKLRIPQPRPLMRHQSYQKNPQLLQLSVPKTQKPLTPKPLMLDQNYHQLYGPLKLLLSEIIPLMLSLLLMSKSVPKPLELNQNMFQPQLSHLPRATNGLKLDSPKLINSENSVE